MHKRIDVKFAEEKTPDPRKTEGCNCACGEGAVKSMTPDPPPINVAANSQANSA